MRLIDLDELLKFPIRRNHCDKENANPHFINGIETVFEYAEQLPTLGWIPVTERLPEVASKHKETHRNNTYTKSIRVLCACVQKDGKRMVKEGYCEIWNERDTDPWWRIPGSIDSVTHWMPLPEAPKDGE